MSDFARLLNRSLVSIGIPVSLALLSLVSTFAQIPPNISSQVEIFPAEPSTNDKVTIKLSGTWVDTCVPKDPKASISGHTVRIDSSNLSEVCTPVFTAWTLTITVGQLPACSYQLIATYSGLDQARLEIARKAFNVTQAELRSAQDLILPIVAKGPVYQTTFTVINPSTSAVQATLQVHNGGGPLTGVFCPAVECPASVASALLPPGGAFRPSTSADLPYLVGWARLTWDAPVGLQAEAEISFTTRPESPCLPITSRASSEIIASVRVQAVRPATHFWLPVNMVRNRRNTMVALVNPSTEERIFIRVTLRNLSGDIVEQGGPVVSPQRQVFNSAWDIAKNPIDLSSSLVPEPLAFSGTLEINSDIPIAVAGLDVLFPEGKFVTVPVSSSQP